MVTRLLIIALLTAVVPAWGGVTRQLCLSCHPVHYGERGGCGDCHRGNPASDRKNIAHAGIRAGKYIRFTIRDAAEIKETEQLMDQLACRRCHVSGGRGNRLASSLDTATVRRSAGELITSIRKPVTNMPYFGLDDVQITTLVNIIYAGSQGRKTDQAAPVRVHFNTSGKKNKDIFSTKCGSCHRLLTERLGAIGSGDIGPNLSGLFSEFYPKTYKSGETWTAANLRTWLKNPRVTRASARMRPVILTDAELKDLESVISLQVPSI